uniref:doublesex- and mab-3-related transcription factor C1-like n=1 Tax=Nyctereutes procyonoides TaxID=34880 RepID=UPI002443A237|nr:doublesex- and mab-3-related transcription factor C1-like [Nyctereutes procyonoides]XP_055194020.1 doublesex- and mab-3-related transcription factor C1 [Nyctereutes procyonoides]
MDPNEMPAVPCCPSDSPTGLETGAPWGIELGPKRAVSRCVRCYNHGFTEQIKDQEHFCPFQTCNCHKCAFFSEHRSVLPAESALNKEQGAHLKRHLAQGLTRSGASPPKAHGHVTKLTIQAGVITGKENLMSQLEAHCCAAPGEASTQGALLTGQAPKPLSPSWTPAALRMQLTISVSRKTHRIPALRSLCSALVLQPCAILGPVLLQPQIPEASDQDLVSASEWQRKLEAAEALLILRDSTQESSGSIFLLQPCVAAAPAGDTGLQPPSPSLRPRPATTISLPIGHLGCISFLS